MNVFGVPIPTLKIFLERIEGGVGENAVLRGPNAGDQRGMARVGHGGDDAGHSFSVGAFLEEAAEVGQFSAMSVGGGYAIGTHAVDGDKQEDGRGRFLGRGAREAKEWSGENQAENEKETGNFGMRRVFVHFGGKDTANSA